MTISKKNAQDLKCAILALLLFALLNTNEIGTYLTLNDVYIQAFASISILLLISMNIVNIRSVGLMASLFLMLYLYILLYGSMQSNNLVSSRKLLETSLIYLPLLMLALKGENDKVLIYFVYVNLLYQLPLFLTYVSGLESGAISQTSRSGAISESYHRIGRMACIGVIGFAALYVTRHFDFRKPLFIVFCICCVLAPINVLLSANRGGLVALVISFAVVLIHGRTKRMTQFLVVSIASLFLGYTLFPQVELIAGKTTYALFRFEGIIVGTSSAFERIDMWYSALLLGLKNFPLGVGYGLWPEASGFYDNRHPHNLFLELFSEIGIASILFLGALLIAVKKFPFWRQAVILSLLIQAMYGGDFTDNRHLVYFLFM